MVDGLKARYLVLLCIIIAGIASVAGMDYYEMIGKGGPDFINLGFDPSKQESDSRYMIFHGLPDLSGFQLPQEANESKKATDYLNDEDRTLQGGHVFRFKGELRFGEYPGGIYSIPFQDYANIIVQNFSDVTCRQQYREPLTCRVSSGYVVDADGNLYRIQDVTVLPSKDRYKSHWEYVATGYLLRVQVITTKSTAKLNQDNELIEEGMYPDPGRYKVTWSGVDRVP